jgi:dUTP pyrophosphatase
MLNVRLLEAGAKAPVCSRPGEDLGYDLFALEDTVLYPGVITKVRTGIAVAAEHPVRQYKLGLIIKDRSSMASKGIFTHGGVIDAGYRGEVVVLMTKDAGTLGESYIPVKISAGDKIAQMVPVPVLTGSVQTVDELEEADRGEKGFGSSGR